MRSFSFFLLAAWLCLSLGAYAQTTYYVDGINGDDANNGTQANPVATITQAIDLAVNGDVIQVLVGNYTESIVIDKSLSIIANEASLTSDISPLISISASDVSFQGFSLSPVTDNASTGISISTPSGEASDVSIFQNTISNFEIGINIVNATSLSSLNINNNFINGNTNGIIVRQAVQITSGAISNNDLSGNTDNALINQSNRMINASANWWGGYRDPTNVTGELSVSNGTINDRIDYNPWLNSSDADASEVGFQADLSELSIRKQTNNTTELAEALELIEDDGEITVFNSAVNNNDDSDNYDAVTITKEVTLIAENNQGPILSGLTLDENLDLEGTFTVQALSINNGAILDVENLSIPLSIASEFAERGIVGPVTTLPMQVGSGVGVQALGVSIPAGPEALGVVSIFRNAGVRAIENNNYQSIQVVWDISVANNSFATRNVTFQWPSDYDNSVEVTDAVVWKNPDDADIWEIADINQDPVNAVQEGSNIRSVSVNVNSFSQFTVSDVNQPLPVELTRFSASLLEPHVELNWETASEINSDFFSVERSQNGIDFSEIGQIKAAGDSDAPLQYRYIDEQAANRLSGSVFYRLRTVDFDGSFEYSDITIVTLSDDDIPMIAAFAREGHPNLKLFTRAIEPGDYTVWITDLNGRKIFEQDLQLLPKESYELGVGHLPQSVYLIRCEGRQLALSTKFRVEEIE